MKEIEYTIVIDRDGNEISVPVKGKVSEKDFYISDNDVNQLAIDNISLICNYDLQRETQMAKIAQAKVTEEKIKQAHRENWNYNNTLTKYWQYNNKGKLIKTNNRRGRK